MLEILVYAFGIMYTPGPVNMLCLHTGIQAKKNTLLKQQSTEKNLGFCVGVGFAMMLLFLFFGYFSTGLVTSSWQIPASLLGCLYITYLAYKITKNAWLYEKEEVTCDLKERANTPRSIMSFHTGFIMQLFNPKAPVAILPIVTIQFPAAGIDGTAITIWAVVMGMMAFGAPGSYLLLGSHLGKMIKKKVYFRWINTAMAGLLFYVAIDIALTQLTPLYK